MPRLRLDQHPGRQLRAKAVASVAWIRRSTRWAAISSSRFTQQLYWRDTGTAGQGEDLGAGEGADQSGPACGGFEAV